MKNKYYQTRESVEEYIQLAKDVDGRALIEKFTQVISPGNTILEIGSGPGSDWKILSGSYHTIGSDNSTFFIEHLKSKHTEGDFILLDAVTLKTDMRFDGIYSNKVLHHLNDGDLIKSIRRQYEILTTKGIICHSFWKGKGSEEYNGMTVNYQTKQSLIELFKNNFEILSIEDYKEFEDSDSLLLIGRKK